MQEIHDLLINFFKAFFQSTHIISVLCSDYLTIYIYRKFIPQIFCLLLVWS